MDRRRLLRPGPPVRPAAGLVRLLFVLSCLLPGPQFLIYLMLWVILPNEK